MSLFNDQNSCVTYVFVWLYVYMWVFMHAYERCQCVCVCVYTHLTGLQEAVVAHGLYVLAPWSISTWPAGSCF